MCNAAFHTVVNVLHDFETLKKIGHLLLVNKSSTVWDRWYFMSAACKKGISTELETHKIDIQWRSNRPDRSDNVRPIIQPKKKKKWDRQEKGNKKSRKAYGKKRNFLKSR